MPYVWQSISMHCMCNDKTIFTKATAFSVENKARYLTKLVEGQNSMEPQAGAFIQTYTVITLWENIMHLLLLYF